MGFPRAIVLLLIIIIYLIWASQRALSCKVKEEAEKGETVVCSLMADEMTIKQHITWDGKKYRGFVDIGN